MSEEAASGSSSPKSSKIKFFCSRGGKILPRPSDGFLKYVGGETCIICVPRRISFSGLMKKITDIFEGDVVLKYQVGSEELDALVSVKSNEDLHYMFDEYDRLEKEGAIKLRAYLFPTKVVKSHTLYSPALDSSEQRFLDAINGIVQETTNSKPTFYTNRLKTISIGQSECTRPRSPSPYRATHSPPINGDNALFSNNPLGRINRVHSSPSPCDLVNQSTQLTNTYHHFRHPRPCDPNYHNHPHHHHTSYQPPFNKLPHDHHVTMQPWPSNVRDGIGRVPSVSNLGPMSYQSSAQPTQFYMGCPESGGHNRQGYLGKPATLYRDGSASSGNVSPTHRGIVWE